MEVRKQMAELKEKLLSNIDYLERNRISDRIEVAFEKIAGKGWNYYRDTRNYYGEQRALEDMALKVMREQIDLFEGFFELPSIKEVK